MEQLKELRTRKGYSQQELADLSDVAQHTISEIELGRRKPQGRTLRKMAAALGVEVSDLLEVEERPKGPSPLSAEWALKIPPDTFEREIQAAETDPLRRLVAELAGDLSKQTLEAWKRDPGEDAQRARARRGIALSLAYIVRNELVARGERPPEKGLPELQRWIDATDG